MPLEIVHVLPESSRAQLGGNEGGSVLPLVLPGSGEGLDTTVVARQAVDTALDQDQAELGVLVVAVALQVLVHGDGLLDQVVQILRDLGGQTSDLQDAQDLGAGHVLNLINDIKKIDEIE